MSADLARKSGCHCLPGALANLAWSSRHHMPSAPWSSLEFIHPFSGLWSVNGTFIGRTCVCWEAKGPGSFLWSVRLCADFLRLARIFMALLPHLGCCSVVVCSCHRQELLWFAETAQDMFIALRIWVEDKNVSRINTSEHTDQPESSSTALWFSGLMVSTLPQMLEQH